MKAIRKRSSIVLHGSGAETIGCVYASQSRAEQELENHHVTAPCALKHHFISPCALKHLFTSLPFRGKDVHAHKEEEEQQNLHDAFDYKSQPTACHATRTCILHCPCCIGGSWIPSTDVTVLHAHLPYAAGQQTRHSSETWSGQSCTIHGH